MSRPTTATPEWLIAPGLTDYGQAITTMQARIAAIRDAASPELIWLVEHPPLYTAGTSAHAEDLQEPERFPTYQAGRGGQWTYHGPGQRVAYVMLDLSVRGRDVRAFVEALQAWIIEALARLGVSGDVREGRVGVWVERPGPAGSAREDKVAAIGVKLRRWVSFHGVSLNVDPDLDHFGGIVPCGVTAHGVTSLADLGAPATLAEADTALRAAFVSVFGPVADASPPL